MDINTRGALMGGGFVIRHLIPAKTSVDNENCFHNHPNHLMLLGDMDVFCWGETKIFKNYSD